MYQCRLRSRAGEGFPAAGLSGTYHNCFYPSPDLIIIEEIPLPDDFVSEIARSDMAQSGMVRPDMARPDMERPMLQFVSHPQHQPEKRPALERRQDFREIYEGFDPERAGEQAGRCSQCGIPFCSSHCPLGNDIPDWLRLARAGRLEEAYELSSATNSFPEICGRICPQDRLCEGNCVINKDFRSVTIGAIERFITENAFAEGWVRAELPACERGQSIGIIGAGPAGLACAERLRAEGYEVHVYDRNPKPGGLLMYGIPSFKLEKDIVERRWHLLETQGIQFHLGQGIGGQEGKLSFESVRARHDALFVATGVYRPRQIKLPGTGLKGIIEALDFLIASQHDPGKHDMAGRHVVVLGGGDTAMDCVRTALRQKAAKVTCVYRRDRENMPGSRQEVKNAIEEGGHFYWLAAPEAFLGEDSVTGVRVREMRLGVVDGQGRRTVEPTGSHNILQADAVICAFGFEAEDLQQRWQTPQLALTEWGTLDIPSGNYETSLPGVFAGGDIVRGASLVVWAIRDGREAAKSIHQALLARISGHKQISEDCDTYMGAKTGTGVGL